MWFEDKNRMGMGGGASYRQQLGRRVKGPPWNTHPVAKFVQWMPRTSQASKRPRVPITFTRITSSLWSSHQSTLGRPVNPAQFKTWVGLKASISAATCSTFSRRLSAAFARIPFSCSIIRTFCPIQPVFPPNTRYEGDAAIFFRSAVLSSRRHFLLFFPVFFRFFFFKRNPILSKWGRMMRQSYWRSWQP